jgi:D-sedoheptulose 7-phosphate isomerase
MGRRWAEQLSAHLDESARVHALTARECGRAVETAVETIVRSLRTGGKLMICGNGGSAADSQHMAAELTCRLTKDFPRPGIAALALTTDSSFLTAYANDIGFDGVFERQVQAVGRPGDVLLGISTSAGSENVRRAIRQARDTGIATIALVGGDGPLVGEADVAIVIPSSVTAYVQEAMLPVEHVICHAVERELFPD